MNITNEVTAIDVKTTQKGGLQTTGDCPRDVSAGTWMGIPEIDAPDYARKHPPEGVDSLSVDMGKNGQLQNIVLVKKADGRYECIIGNGRLEAAKKLGWSQIRADVKEGLNETQKLLMTLAENNEREDASPFYTASLYQRLMNAKSLDKTGLAKELGKDPTLVMKYMSLASVTPEVQRDLNAFRLGLRQCLAIAKLPKAEDQLQVAKECATQDLAGKALEKRIKQLLNPKPAASEAAKPQEPEGPFQFTRKGKGFQLRSLELPALDMLDVYMQDLRGALVEFLGRQREEAGTRYAA